MSDNGPAFTDTPYEPPEEIQPLLAEAAHEVEIHKSNKREVSMGPFDAIKDDYEAHYEGFALDGHETTSPLGHMLSLSGHLGAAATTVLVSSLQFGEPTLLYLDTVEGNLHIDDYEDLTAEWYTPEAVEQDIPEERMRQRSGMFQFERVGLNQLEEWALKWLSLKSREDD